MIGKIFERELEARLRGCVPVKAFDELAARVARLEEENRKLRENVVKFKKEIFSVKDLADMLLLDPATVRKNYISTGKIQATKIGKHWEVGRSEFMRVRDVVKTRGLSYL